MTTTIESLTLSQGQEATRTLLVGQSITVTGVGEMAYRSRRLGRRRLRLSAVPQSVGPFVEDIDVRLVAAGAVSATVSDAAARLGVSPALWSGSGLVRPDGSVRSPFVETDPPVPALSSEPPFLTTAAVVTDGPDSLLLNLATVLPNPYPAEANVPIHPSLLFVPGGWRGYRYWLAWTPYPSSNAELENPCVAASNDLVTWVAPAGNLPVVPSPPGTDFNADPCLFFNADRSLIHLAWRERGSGTNFIRCVTSADGVNWSEPQVLVSGVQGTQDYASPSIWWNGTGWTMMTHQLDASSPWPVQRSVSLSASLFGGFGAPTTVTIPPFAGRSWWSSRAKRLASGQIVALFQDNSGSPGASGDLYWAESMDDGALFSVGALVDRPGGKYGSDFALRGTEVDLFVGTLTSIQYRRCQTNRLTIRDDFIASQFAFLANPSYARPGLIWADNFVRGDSAVSLGTAASGGTYTASSGVWGILTNRAYPVSGSPPRVLAAAGTPNFAVSVRFLDMTTAVQQWLLARVVDGSNLWRIGATSPTASGSQTLALQEVVAGSVVNTFIAGRFFRGDVITLECVGTTINTYINGIQSFSLQSSRHIGGASFGMQANVGANTFMKDLVCVSRAL